MKTRIFHFISTTAIALTTTAALAQVSKCYHRSTLAPTQSSAGNNCASYIVCPSGHICGTGGWKKTPSNITTGPVNCTSYISGTGTFPNCTGGSLVLGTPMTVTVPDQQCTGLCIIDADPS